MYDPQQQRVTLTVHIQPGASANAFCGLHGDALKIRVAAPAVDNKANAALLAFLAKTLDVRLAYIHLRRSTKGRCKVIEISAATDSDAAHMCKLIRAASIPD